MCVRCITDYATEDLLCRMCQHEQQREINRDGPFRPYIAPATVKQPKEYRPGLARLLRFLNSLGDA